MIGLSNSARWIAALLVCTATVADAQDAFNTFNGPVGIRVYTLDTGHWYPSRLGWLFTAETGGEVSAITIGATSASAASTAVVSIHEATADGRIGVLLGEIDVPLPPGGSQTPPTLVPTPASGIHLTAGNEYFLTLRAGTWLEWYTYGPPFISGVMAHSVLNQPWSYNPDPQFVYPGFSITVPAPSASATLLTVAVVTLRRRRRT